MRTKKDLKMERLETRQLMTANLAGADMSRGMLTADEDYRAVTVFSTEIISLNQSNGCVEIQGSDSMDRVTIEDTLLFNLPSAVSPLSSPTSPGVRVTHEDVISGNETVRTFALAEVHKICFDGQGHNDIFTNLTAIPSDVTGGEGDDQLYGGSGDDVLRGGDGSDLIEGNAGDDVIYGGDNGDEPDILRGNGGSDRIYGRNGNDIIEGGIGHDYLEGGDGDDTLDGGDGNDTIYGDAADSEEGGRDVLIGGEGNDFLYGGPQGDLLEGDAGSDELRGEDGPDVILGNQGDDQVWGGQGADVLEGGEDNDILRGGDGPDRIYGGGGEDELFGGEGDDGLWGGGGEDALTGGDGNDRFLIQDVKDEDDVITDEANADVQVHFENGDRVKHGGIWFEAESWLYDEILEVDEALAELVARTHNNSLLKTASGKELTFIRVGDPEAATDAVAWNRNGTGKITISDKAFDDYNAASAVDKDDLDDFIHHAVIHEIGHNWDDENDNWGVFKDLSGWSNPLFGPWQFDESAADFVTDYAMESPHEDFAETFAATFLFSIGEDVTGNRVNSMDEIPEKRDFMEDFLDSL